MQQNLQTALQPPSSRMDNGSENSPRNQNLCPHAAVVHISWAAYRTVVRIVTWAMYTTVVRIVTWAMYTTVVRIVTSNK